MSVANEEHKYADINVLNSGTVFSNTMLPLLEPTAEQKPIVDNGWGPATFDFLDFLSAEKTEKKAYISGHLYTRTQAENCLQFYKLLCNYMKCNLHFYSRLNLAHSTDIDGRSNIRSMLQDDISPEELYRTVIKAGMGQIHIAMSEGIEHRKEKSWYAYDRLLEDTGRYIDFSQNRNYFAHAHGVIGKDGYEFTGGIYTTIATKYKEILPKIELIVSDIEQVLNDATAWEVRVQPEEVVAVWGARSENGGESNVGTSNETEESVESDGDDDETLVDERSSTQLSDDNVEDSQPDKEIEDETSSFEYEPGFLATSGRYLLRSRVVRGLADRLYRYIDRRWTEWEHEHRQSVEDWQADRV